MQSPSPQSTLIKNSVVKDFMYDENRELKDISNFTSRNFRNNNDDE